MASPAAAGGVFATVAHLKLSGELKTADFDEADLESLFHGIRMLLRDWDPEKDDTAVIRIMSSSEN